MEITLKQQTIAFLWSFVLGIILVLVYIIVAVIRTLSPPNKIQMFIGDVLFMVFAAIINFLFATAFTEGNVRFYTIFAELLAFFTIYLTVGKIIKKVIFVIYVRTEMIIKKIMLPLRAFIGGIFSSIIKKCSFMLKKVKKSKKVRHFPLHCRHKVLYNNDKSVRR